MKRSVYSRFSGHSLLVLDDSNQQNLNLLSFPPEIFSQIFAGLPVEDFFAILCVCKTWRKIGLTGFTPKLEFLSPWLKKSDSVASLLIHGHTISQWVGSDQKKKYLLYGGWTPEGGVNDSLYIYDKEDQENLWGNKRENVAFKGPAIFAHSASLIGNSLYLFGGSNGRDKYTNDIHKLDLVSRTSTKLKTSGNIPGPRAYHRTVEIGKKILVFGGQMTQYKNSKKQPIWYNDIHLFDTETERWTKIETSGNPPPESGAGSLVLYNKTEIIYFGGGKWKKFIHYPEEIQYFNDTYKLDTKTWNWTKLEVSGIPPSPRAGHAAVIIGNYMLVTAGYISLGHRWPTYQDTFLLNLGTLEWQQSHMIQEKMGNHNMVVDDNIIYLVGGIDYDSNLTSNAYYCNFMESIIPSHK